VAGKAWSGVFTAATDRRVEQFSESISFDRRLYAHDIQASIAHAQMLAAVGLLAPDECQKIEQGLTAIRQEIEQGRFEFKVELEDIHLHIERSLIDRLGDIGRKLHTARSRNDQVATDLRLWQREAIDQIDVHLLELQRAFVGRAVQDVGCILPGYTHLQRAQPVLAAHYLLAYVQKYQRDRDRLADCRRRTRRLASWCGCVRNAAAACRSIGKIQPVGWDLTASWPTASMRRAIAISCSSSPLSSARSPCT
jgi:argininosuccinate lyase